MNGESDAPYLNVARGFTTDEFLSVLHARGFS